MKTAAQRHDGGLGRSLDGVIIIDDTPIRDITQISNIDNKDPCPSDSYRFLKPPVLLLHFRQAKPCRTSKVSLPWAVLFLSLPAWVMESV